ncbi:MAG: endonuclease MutS2, partial [Chloroflexaceae bacterium]|nr:endonuclease MutS2 [Chloroflexaceae bacterium]
SLCSLSLLQEALVTVRNGRYVVPVRADKRRALPGIVQDQSASGATLYIEPLAVVELNNQWREAQLAEQKEIERILIAISEQVGRDAEAIVTGIEALAVIDLGLAQARYAYTLRCVAPELTDLTTRTYPLPAPDETALASVPSPAAPLLLTAARHPLLNQETVVPIDIWLGDPFRILMITGPNTGGKTVALKTVGLLVLMAQAGLHIPAREPARLPIFQQVFADIGDEQSIEQSLSTFSSHMTNIISILEAIEQLPLPPSDDGPHLDDSTVIPAAISPTLVLLDELGAGTDPVEGSALARSIVTRLLERGCLAVSTTHFAELKVFAHNTPGVQNASVEFDVESLAPTYRLTIGLPGRSNALAIARRLGLDAGLIERARATIVREEAQIEDLLADIRREREAMQAERQRAADLREDAEKYRERLAAELYAFAEQREASLEALEREIEAELRELRADLRRQRGSSRSADIARQWSEEAEQRVQAVRERLHAHGQPSAAAQLVQPPTPQAPRPLQAGDTVLVRSVGLIGEILDIDDDDDEADVQVGGFRMRVGLNELRRQKHGDQSDEPARTYSTEQRTITLPPMPDVSMSFDMRGWRAAEVEEKLDRYLNDAYLAGLPSVRLIHGKGSGALRQVVRDIVRQHPLVNSFSGGGADGGEGVTIARLVER